MAVVLAALAVPLGAGCSRDREKEAEAPRVVESPRLEAWELPLAEGPELLSNSVTTIHRDIDGVLWFGTLGGGASRFDPKNRSWSTYTIKDGLADSNVQTIAQDAYGSLWFATSGGGVSRFDPKNRSWFTYTTKDGLADNNVQAIAQSADGSLWFGTLTGGVSRFDPLTRSWSTYTTKDGLADNDVQAIAQNADGSLWFGTSGGGVSRFDPKTRSWSTYTTKDGLADNSVQAIAQNADGSLWFGTLGGGVSRFDPLTRSWSTYTTKDGLADNYIRAITQDADGSLWFGTSGGGVSRFDPLTRSWSTYTTKDDLADNSVQSIAQDADGSLWFGTLGGGVSRFDPKTRAWSTYAAKTGLADNNVQAIAQDADGSLWFGTLGGGVSRFDPKTRSWFTYTTKDGLADNNVQAIAQDADGSLWFGTWGGGVSRFNPKTRSWSTYTTTDITGQFVRAIALDADGSLWLGTLDERVSRFDPKTRSWSTYTTQNGVAHNGVQAIAQDADGSLWFGTSGGGVSRFDPKTRSWLAYTTNDGLAGNNVQAITQGADGSLWFGTSDGGVSRFDPKTRSWLTYTTSDGLAGNNVQAITQDADGSLWFGTSDGGVSRFDPKTRSWSLHFTLTKAGFNPLRPNRIRAASEGASTSLWAGARSGVIRLVRGRSNEAGTMHTIAPSDAKLAITGALVAVTRPNGLSLLARQQKEWLSVLAPLPSFPVGANVTALAPGPSGAVWAGTDLSGLTLRRWGRDVQITQDQRLPSATVTAISPVPDTGNTRVWVGTTAGPALVTLEGETPHVEPIRWERMLSGPVDALVAAEDGSVFIAYNAIPRDHFLDSELAERRSRTRIFHLSTRGTPRELVTGDTLAGSEVRDLAFSPQHGLWAGTSAGLFVVKPPGKENAGTEAERFEPVTGKGRLPQMSIRRLAIAPDESHTLWMGIDRQGDTPPLVVGYHPGTGSTHTLTREFGVPSGGAIDDLAFTPDGELVILVGSTLARGSVFVPITPAPPPATRSFWLITSVLGALIGAAAAAVAIAHRRNLYLRTPLADLALSGLPSALASMRRFRVLDESWSRLGLPETRIPLIEATASATPHAPEQLRALAELLGMENAASAPVKELPHGLSLLAARLPYPAPLRGHTVALVSLDLAQARSAEPAHLRAALESALEDAGQRFELPFVLVARDDVARDLLPADLASLRLGEREFKALLFARNPQHTFAGLLHARRLVAVSPYATAGEVKDEQMFFGRVALLKELLLASSIQHIVIGPRRVGKTSLLKRLLRELPARRPDVEAVFVDLLGVADHARAARTLARTLKIDAPRDQDPETAFADLLRARFQESGKKGVVLLDEADGLIEADAARGFPLLSAMRTLQAEEVCSFVLAGYLFLYRESLNQRSPLYNFATVRMLGPLEPEAARDLALVPMQRLGVAYADPELPAQIAERTGGYPSFVQVLCDAALDVLRDAGSGDLVLSAEHIAQAEQKVGISLRDIFHSNAGEEAQLLVYRLLDRDDFSRSDAEQALAGALGRHVPAASVDRALQELRLFGFLVEQDGRFSFAIPLLRDTLRAGDPARAAEQLLTALSRSG
ncbi:two-component regulator propeller domain-containing protein [Sorangium sp. So ce233]|uniref:two-component regulator propeller domain-containing protein n=1 Tax=Sorangium sp. So ce233 TaxID=3133290 RepID=UPI003F605592